MGWGERGEGRDAYSGFLEGARTEACSKEFCAGPALEHPGQLTARPSSLETGASGLSVPSSPGPGALE